MTALEQARELEKQRQKVLDEGTDEALKKATNAFRELQKLVDEQLKTIRQALGQRC
jgi:hypothetical protein